MKLTIPELSLVVLVGPSGSGKSTFARRHFKPTEILSSDYCRGLVSDDENDQAATKDAFEVLHFIAAKRLAAGKLTVIDATNAQPEARQPLVALARQYHCLPVAIVFHLPEQLGHERNRQRPDRDLGPHVVRQQSQQLRRSNDLRAASRCAGCMNASSACWRWKASRWIRGCEFRRGWARITLRAADGLVRRGRQAEIISSLHELFGSRWRTDPGGSDEFRAGKCVDPRRAA
jgi:predicted kinase